MQLSKKPKIFCCNFIAFSESKLDSEHFEKKTSFITISEISDSERRGYLNA